MRSSVIRPVPFQDRKPPARSHVRWGAPYYFVLLLFFVFAVVGPSIVLSSQENDANTIQEMSETASFLDEEGSSYAIMAFIYSVTNEPLRRLIVLIVGLVYINSCFRAVKAQSSIPYLATLLIAPIIMFLTIFQKDTTSTVLVICCFYVLRLDRRWSIQAVLLLYIGYGYVFRPYYLIIAPLFVGLLVIQRFGAVAAVAGVALCGIGAALAPESLWQSLGDSRDTVNLQRIGLGLPGTRTAFLNYQPTNDAVDFIINYGYAFYYLNIRPLLTLDVNDMFLGINIWSYFAMIILTISASSRFVAILSALAAAHLLVLNIFEPDYGSYLRHASTIVLYLTPILNNIVERSSFRTEQAR